MTLEQKQLLFGWNINEMFIFQWEEILDASETIKMKEEKKSLRQVPDPTDAEWEWEHLKRDWKNNFIEDTNLKKEADAIMENVNPDETNLKKKWTSNKVRKKLRSCIYENIAMGDCGSRIKTG
jgi:hypothetical protein